MFDKRTGKTSQIDAASYNSSIRKARSLLMPQVLHAASEATLDKYRLTLQMTQHCGLMRQMQLMLKLNTILIKEYR